MTIRNPDHGVIPLLSVLRGREDSTELSVSVKLLVVYSMELENSFLSSKFVLDYLRTLLMLNLIILSVSLKMSCVLS